MALFQALIAVSPPPGTISIRGEKLNDAVEYLEVSPFVFFETIEEAGRNP